MIMRLRFITGLGSGRPSAFKRSCTGFFIAFSACTSGEHKHMYVHTSLLSQHAQYAIIVSEMIYVDHGTFLPASFIASFSGDYFWQTAQKIND